MSEPTYTLDAVLGATGATYRQLDYWARIGYLGPARRAELTGQGHARAWTRRDLIVAATIADLARAGVSIDVSARIANEHADTGRTVFPSTEDDPRVTITLQPRATPAAAPAPQRAPDPDEVYDQAPEHLDDLVMRLRRGETAIGELIEAERELAGGDIGEGAHLDRVIRLRGKREGLRVARSYIEEMQK